MTWSIWSGIGWWGGRGGSGAAGAHPCAPRRRGGAECSVGCLTRNGVIPSRRGAPLCAPKARDLADALAGIATCSPGSAHGRQDPSPPRAARGIRDDSGASFTPTTKDRRATPRPPRPPPPHRLRRQRHHWRPCHARRQRGDRDRHQFRAGLARGRRMADPTRTDPSNQRARGRRPALRPFFGPRGPIPSHR